MHQKCIKNASNRLHDASKRLPRRPQDAPRRILPPFWAPTWGHLGHLFPPKTASRPPGRLQKAFLGMSWGVLGACWGLLTAKSQQERLLEPSWPDFRPFLEGFLRHFWSIFDRCSLIFWSNLFSVASIPPRKRGGGIAALRRVGYMTSISYINHHFRAPSSLKPLNSSPRYQNLPRDPLIAHSDHQGPVSAQFCHLS